jgi:hypothetical protein
MAVIEVLKGFEARVALHGLHAQACDILSEMWPAIVPCLSDAIDQFLAATHRVR